MPNIEFLLVCVIACGVVAIAVAVHRIKDHIGTITGHIVGHIESIEKNQIKKGQIESIDQTLRAIQYLLTQMRDSIGGDAEKVIEIRNLLAGIPRQFVRNRIALDKELQRQWEELQPKMEELGRTLAEAEREQKKAEPSPPIGGLRQPEDEQE